MLPPLLAGGVKVTVAWAFPAIASTPVGAPGTPAGMTLLEGAEVAPMPLLFVVATVNVYDVPLVRPVTVMGLCAPVAVAPPGLAVTM